MNRMITRSISRELKKISTNHYSSRCRPLTSPIINLDNQYQSHKYNDQLCVFDEDNELIADYNSLTLDFRLNLHMSWIDFQIQHLIIKMIN